MIRCDHSLLMNQPFSFSTFRIDIAWKSEGNFSICWNILVTSNIFSSFNSFSREKTVCLLSVDDQKWLRCITQKGKHQITLPKNVCFHLDETHHHHHHQHFFLAGLIRKVFDPIKYYSYDLIHIDFFKISPFVFLKAFFWCSPKREINIDSNLFFVM